MVRPSPTSETFGETRDRALAHETFIKLDFNIRDSTRTEKKKINFLTTPLNVYVVYIVKLAKFRISTKAPDFMEVRQHVGRGGR